MQGRGGGCWLFFAYVRVKRARGVTSGSRSLRARLRPVESIESKQLAMAKTPDKSKPRSTKKHLRPFSPVPVRQPTSAENVIRSERDLEIIEKRRQHWTYEKIAKEYGISKQRAVQIVQAHLRENAELMDKEVDLLRREEIERLDALAAALEPATQPRPMGTSPSGEVLMAPPDLDVIDRYLKVMVRRAQLQGLDMPVKVAPTDPSGANPYDGTLADARQRLADLLAARVAGK